MASPQWFPLTLQSGLRSHSHWIMNVPTPHSAFSNTSPAQGGGQYALLQSLKVQTSPMIFADRNKGEDMQGRGVIVDVSVLLSSFSQSLVQENRVLGGLSVPIDTDGLPAPASPALSTRFEAEGKSAKSPLCCYLGPEVPSQSAFFSPPFGSSHACLRYNIQGFKLQLVDRIGRNALTSSCPEVFSCNK